MASSKGWLGQAEQTNTSNAPVFLVDIASLRQSDELAYLLSLDGVGGIRVEQHIEIVEDEREEGDDAGSRAVVGSNRSSVVFLGSLGSLRRMAAHSASVTVSGMDAVLRLLALCQLVPYEGADAVVTDTVIMKEDTYLTQGVARISVQETLAMVGAFLRQQNPVPLTPDGFVHERTDAYYFTARLALSHAEDWWSSIAHCAPTKSPDDIVSQAQAVITRVARAIRARDAVHESLRCGEGRPGIEESLYHFDVFLISVVAALDALARVAHHAYKIEERTRKEASENMPWFKLLGRIMPRVLAILAGVGPRGDIKSAGWQNKKWLKLLSTDFRGRANPRLGDVRYARRLRVS